MVDPELGGEWDRYNSWKSYALVRRCVGSVAAAVVAVFEGLAVSVSPGFLCWNNLETGVASNVGVNGFTGSILG